MSSSTSAPVQDTPLSSGAATSKQTSNTSNQPLSRLENLPDELILRITSQTNIPWVQYISPQFHNLLDTQENREKVVRLAFTGEGTPPDQVWPWSLDPASPQFFKYIEQFHESVNLSWFNKAVFEQELIPPEMLEIWSRSVWGVWVMFGNPWSQAQGEFVCSVMNRWPGSFSPRLLPSEGCTHAYQAGVLNALREGNVAAIYLLTGFDVSATGFRRGARGRILSLEKLSDASAYDADTALPSGRWIKRWTTDNLAHVPSSVHNHRLFYNSMRTFIPIATIKDFNPSSSYIGIYRNFVGLCEEANIRFW